ncbi:MAG: hypothetical protein OES32_12965 [Acidobacteriota bacterium]|nr:hypothetical protein [Acidobacteriota bacterium]
MAPSVPELRFAPAGRPPFAVQARVVEDDTWLVLGADPRFRESGEHPIRVHTAAWEAEPATPGSVVVRPGRPLELRAIVHDLARDPTWRPEWVGEALAAVLREAERRRIAALAMPVLGARHGALSEDVFLRLLEDAITAVEPDLPRRIWIESAHAAPRAGARRAEGGRGDWTRVTVQLVTVELVTVEPV